MTPIPELEAIRKAQILDAALNTIAERGCASVTMWDIARAAGLSKGGLAHYFKSKKSLFKTVFNEFFDRIFQKGRETMANFQDPMDKLLSFDWLYDLEDPDINIGYPILFDFMSMVVHESEYREIFHDWINNWVALLKEAIEEGTTTGMFTGVDSDTTARTISAIYQGLATRWFLDPEAHSTDWAVVSFKQAIKGLMQPYMA